MNTETPNPEVNPDRPNFRTLAETELLVKFLQSAEVGQVFTYQEMNAACKDDVQARNTILQTARRTLAKPPHRMVFGTVTGIGIKRLSDEEIPDVGADAVKRSRNIAKSGLRKMACATMANMTPETRFKAIATTTILGLFQASGSRKVKLLADQQARTSTSDKLKIGDVAGLFGK